MNHQFILPLTDCSIQRSLEQYFLQTILPVFQIESCPFYQIPSSTGVIYQSPIAIRLAKGNLEKAHVINHQIISYFKGHHPIDQPTFKVIITARSSGLLEIFLEKQEVNNWLQKLPELFLKSHPFSLSNLQTTEIADQFFPLQYTHARCCSLLRLGHLDQLIQLQTLDFHQSVWFWLSPNPIPFQEINWIQSEERELIAQIIKIIDGLYSLKSMSASKLASDLSESFLEFERCCRIWGAVKRQNLTLAQTRLGLVAIIQLLLRFLLKEKLGLNPIMEL